jgi:hypothetical protein
LLCSQELYKNHIKKLFKAIYCWNQWMRNRTQLGQEAVKDLSLKEYTNLPQVSPIIIFRQHSNSIVNFRHSMYKKSVKMRELSMILIQKRIVGKIEIPFCVFCCVCSTFLTIICVRFCKF